MDVTEIDFPPTLPEWASSNSGARDRHRDQNDTPRTSRRQDDTTPLPDRAGLGSLTPISPAEAIEWYLDQRKAEIRAQTAASIESGLALFEEWCTTASIDNLNDLDGRKLREFRTWRRDTGDIELVTLNGTLAIVRRFLRFAEAIEAVPDGLANKTPLPNVPDDAEVNEFVPDDDLVVAIAEFLDTYRPNSRVHCEHAVIRDVGLRVGAVRAIDLKDIDLDRQEIHLKHRPENGHTHGTPLKNGIDGQRLINVSDELTTILERYIDGPRHDVTDRFGREPLLTTAHGRVTISTIRRDFYKLSRPCVVIDACPHDRVIAECSATRNDQASTCPSSYSPHPLRRWSIMHQLDQGVPIDVLSNRVDVSVPVLEKHYDLRSETRKGRSRRETLREYLDGY